MGRLEKTLGVTHNPYVEIKGHSDLQVKKSIKGAITQLLIWKTLKWPLVGICSVHHFASSWSFI